jgi:hypothetical protein
VNKALYFPDGCGVHLQQNPMTTAMLMERVIISIISIIIIIITLGMGEWREVVLYIG